MSNKRYYILSAAISLLALAAVGLWLGLWALKWAVVSLLITMDIVFAVAALHAWVSGGRQ